MPRDGTGGVPDNDRPEGHDDGEAARKSALIALGVVVALVVISLYVGHILRSSSALEDCEMQGRTNCAPIEGK